MTLTEQYKKERSITEHKDYYVVDDKGCSFIDFFWGEGWLKTPVDDIEEVLAPVPSYEKWQELTTWNKEYKIREKNYGESYEALKKENAQLLKFLEEFNALDVAKENKKLKELLKECREFFYENLIDTEFYFSCGLGSDIKKQSCIRSLSKLTTKIDNAIGEKR